MSITLWAFRDAAGQVRVTPTDPSEVLDALGIRRVEANAPGGFPMRELRRHFETAEGTLNTQGQEIYIRFTLGDLPGDLLSQLMTPTDGDQPQE